MAKRTARNKVGRCKTPRQAQTGSSRFRRERTSHRGRRRRPWPQRATRGVPQQSCAWRDSRHRTCQVNIQVSEEREYRKEPGLVQTHAAPPTADVTVFPAPAAPDVAVEKAPPAPDVAVEKAPAAPEVAVLNAPAAPEVAVLNAPAAPLVAVSKAPPPNEVTVEAAPPAPLVTYLFGARRSGMVLFQKRHSDRVRRLTRRQSRHRS